MSAAQVVVVPVGGANFGSLRRALQRLDVEPVFSADRARVEAASHVILPGVGSAGAAMQSIRALGVDQWLPRLGQPLLGICLGMQLLFEASEEGDCRTLGLLPGVVRRLPAEPVWPHMGWNRLHDIDTAAPLLSGVSNQDWFYFVHGYAVSTNLATLASSNSGAGFTAVAGRGNVFGTQFHPEKSAQAGRRVLQNFLAL